MINEKTEIATVKGIIDRGCENPKRTYSSLTNNPTNIEENKLKPTDIKNNFIMPSSFSLSSLRIANPGTNDR